MSGGVDSSVAALLIKQQLAKEYLLSSSNSGSTSQQIQPLIGIHMSNWDANSSEDHDEINRLRSSSSSSSSFPTLAACHEQDYKDAKAVASTLDIPLQHVSFGSDYWTLVFEPFCQSIAQGVTPNPDTACNRHIKFGSLIDFVTKKWGHDQFLLATGHYARLWHRQSYQGDDIVSPSQLPLPVLPPPSDVQEALDQDPVLADWLIKWGDTGDRVLPPLLLSALDKSKDQSYFLSTVPGKAFTNVIFPLGDLAKNEPVDHASSLSGTKLLDSLTTSSSVRYLAKAYGLPTASKKDSIGLCFVGKRRKFINFIQQYLPHPLPHGVFINVDDGQVVAHHNGPGLLLTVGQGAKIPNASAKWFVVGRDAEYPSNIFVGAGTNHPALYTNTVQVHGMNWMAGVPPPPLLSTTTSLHRGFGSSSYRNKSNTVSAWCRVRHLHDLVPCDLQWDPITNMLTVHSHAPIRAVTPGQTMVVYVGGDGLICLGGGPVAAVGPSYHQLGLPVVRVPPTPSSNDQIIATPTVDNQKIITVPSSLSSAAVMSCRL